jgi:hypothetical protein
MLWTQRFLVLSIIVPLEFIDAVFAAKWSRLCSIRMFGFSCFWSKRCYYACFQQNKLQRWSHRIGE